MADAPPRFRPAAQKDREPWGVRDGRKDRRLRGRAGQRARAEVMADEPFCRLCLEDGKHVRSEVVDHIKPLARGGSDERRNKQALCRRHHDEKSALERAEDRSFGS